MVKLLVNKSSASIDSILELFKWSITSESENSYEIIGDIDETKLDNVKEYLVSKYIEQKVSEPNAAATK